MDVELWHFRELLYFLAWRDVKVRINKRFRRCVAIIQRFTMLIFTSFLPDGEYSSGGIPYPLFSTPRSSWTYFAGTLARRK